MSNLNDRIRQLIASACEDMPLEQVPQDASLDDMPEWDSLAHIALIELIEREFGRTIPPDRVAELRSVETIAKWLSEDAAEESANEPAAADADLAGALREAGLTAGDMVMVHSFTAALRGVERPDRALIDALLGVLGPEGTLVLPAFTYSFCRTRLYRPDEDRSEVGVAADTLRLEYQGRRTLAPIFSVVAKGARAEEIAALSSPTTFGPGSIFDYLLQSRGKLCGVGVGFEKITFNHYPEEELQVPYRYWKQFDGEMERRGDREAVSVRYFVRSLEPEAVRDQSKIAALMEKAPFARSAAVAGAEVVCAPVQQYYRRLRDAMIADPLFQLSDASRGHWH